MLARNHTALGGFTLIEITIALAVLAVILAGILPFITSSNEQSAATTTLERMEAIDAAIAGFVAANDRMPCPSDLNDALDDTNFGLGDPTGGTCINGDPVTNPSANRLGGNDIAVGGVPVKDIGLSDEYAFDGYGQRISYHVYQPLTAANGIDSAPAAGTVMVEVFGDDAGAVVRTDEAVYLLLSHGSRGHGAFLRNGQARKNLGQAGNGELVNCDCTALADPPADYSGYDATFVQRSATVVEGLTQFDDIVSYKLYNQVRGAAATAEGSGAALWKADGLNIYDASTGTPSEGNVGIGTETPSEKLTVNGDSLFLQDITVQGSTTSNSADINTATIDDITVSGSATMNSASVSGTASLGTASVTGNATVGGTLSVTSTSTFTGNVGVGGAPGAGTQRLTVRGGDLDMTGGDINNVTQINPPSDRRLKRDIAALKPKAMLEKLLKVEAVRYYFKADGKNRLRYGVIAQDIETVFPSLVKTDDDEQGSKSVNYLDLIAPMIAAMQEQQRQIEALRKEIEALKEADTTP